MAAPAGTGNDRAYSRPATRDDFEIAIICALTREMDAVELLVDEFWTDGHDQTQYGRAPSDSNSYELARIGKFNVVLVVLPSMGKVDAAAAAHGVATSYPNISLVLVVGVCGGMPFANVGGEREEIVLGDVVISSTLNQYDFGRQLPDRFLSKSGVEDTFGRPNRDLRGLLKSLEKMRTRNEFQRQAADNLVKLQERSGQLSRYTYPGTDKDRLFEASYEHKHHRPASVCLPCAQGLICESSWEISCDDIGCDARYLVQRKRCGQPDQPMVFIGRVGSADAVVRSAKHRDTYAEKGIIALEMEGAGVWDVLPCLVIKGVCDYADSHKNKGWQGYAAATAASVAKAFLNRYQGTGKISRNASEHQTIPTPAPFLNAPFQLDDDFVERDEIMSWLQTEIKDTGSRAALVGFGGVGKSRLVIRYARNTQRTSPQTYVLWVYAGTQALFIGSFREIAQELSLDGWDNVKVDVLRLVLDWLRSGNRQWLMILDNADDINVFDPKPDERKDSDSGAASSTALKPLDFLRRCQNGNILITSRSEKVARRLGVGLHFRRVEPMIKGQARQLLRHKLATVEDESGEENLVDALDCIPLAITQAAAYINHLASTGRTSVRVYLEQFRQSENNQAVLLNHLPEDEASGPVFTTWIITYEHIRKERPSASDLLSLLSFFYHRGIPEWVLERYYKNFETYHPHAKLPQDCLDPLAEDVAMLCSYSLVTVVPMIDNRDNQQPNSRSLQMHALVHTCTRHWVRSKDSNGKWLGTFIHLLDAEHLELEKYDFEDWTSYRDLSPHVDSLVESNGLDSLEEIHTVRLVRLLEDSAAYSDEVGTLERSERLLMKALKLAETKLCKAHEAIACVIGRIHLLNQFEHNETLRGTVALIEVIIRVLGHMRSYPEEEALYRAFLERRMRLPDEVWWGPHCFYTEEKIVHELCDVLMDQRKFQEAEALLRRLHSEYNPGAVDPEETAEKGDYLFTFGQVLFYQNKFDQAEKIFREGSERIHALNKLDFAEPSGVGMGYYRWIGYTLASQGKHGEASDCFRQILEWSKQLQLLEHPDTLHIYENLVESLMPLENYGEAEDILKQCINLMQRKFKHQPGKRCHFLRQLLEVMKAQGKDEDEEYYDYQDQLAELEGWDTSDSDEDDSSEEPNGGSELSPDGSQAGSEGGHSLEHYATKRKIAHSVRPNIGRSASEESDSLDDVSTASRAIEKLHVGGRLERRENASRHGLRKLASLGLGKRWNLHAERASEDLMRLSRLLKEVEKKAGEESDKERNDVRGDDDEVDEEVE
ncbi:hypothetical protein QBC32DRAFT_269854 [Pseudoneurospora amorphoporcata]|uniref:Nucleoside phosphorylase domain-containing protein n=1 Tax=Pseudoneurospora amorphoporcata TaxID=241081 RepID=A0AAN6NLA4_9PEZI|nr:hypothetical protein QBC32DRAFT_269854 [Pseudoneurospora amorphoporcata]